MTGPRAAAIASLALALVASACTSFYEIPIETPIQAKLDVSAFSRVLVAGFGEIGLDDLARVGRRIVARDPHLPGGPQPEKPVSPRRRSELQLLVMGELALEALLAFLKSGHLAFVSLSPFDSGASPRKSWGNPTPRGAEG